MSDIKPANKPNPAPVSAPNKSKKKSKRTLVIAASIIVAVALLITVGYLFKQNQQLRNDPAKAEAAQVEKLTDKIGKLMDLPKDETPTVATVEDKSKLQDQPFFRNAQNGDKILIYTATRQAIIYRPSENKIINAGPIAINAQGSDTETKQ